MFSLFSVIASTIAFRMQAVQLDCLSLSEAHYRRSKEQIQDPVNFSKPSIELLRTLSCSESPEGIYTIKVLSLQGVIPPLDSLKNRMALGSVLMSGEHVNPPLA